MRYVSLLGLLIVVVIIAYWAKTALTTPGVHDRIDRSTVEYWVAHEADRKAMLSWCSQHSDQQNSQECKLAIAAQTEVDVRPAAGH